MASLLPDAFVCPQDGCKSLCIPSSVAVTTLAAASEPLAAAVGPLEAFFRGVPSGWMITRPPGPDEHAHVHDPASVIHGRSQMSADGMKKR